MSKYLLLVLATSILAIASALPIDEDKNLPKVVLSPAEVTHYKPHPEFIAVNDTDAEPNFDEKEVGAALDEFIKSLNLTESEEKDDQIVGTIILGMLEELNNQVEKAEASGKEEDIEAVIKNIKGPFWQNIFKNRIEKLVPPVAVDRKRSEHRGGAVPATS